jgi:transketolase
MGSVMTKFVAQEIPERHFECGIAEQHMVSLGGGLSLAGFIPFVSTFGAFLTSRAKDQARVNDINHTNVKMVATHCGLSVGEDGPTHQAIDDKGAFLGHLNTMIIEPADPNQTDKIMRYIASHYGNFYVRMGRHKFPILTKEDGSIFYGPDYVYEYGKTDTIREGSDITIAASGAMIHEALLAREALQKENSNISVEIVAVSGVKHFDENLMQSIQKTKRVITIEDHNPYSGFGAQLAKQLVENNIKIAALKIMGVEHYQFSGKAEQLYEAAGISAAHIKKACLEMIK